MRRCDVTVGGAIKRCAKRRAAVMAAALFAAVGLALPSPAQAGLVNEDVSVLETFDPLNGIGMFEVTNNSSFDIFAFAVTNDFAFATPFVGSTNWVAQIVDEATWNADVFEEGGIDRAQGWDAPVTGGAGLEWDTLFGEATQALVYWVGNTGAADPIGTGSTVGGFGFSSFALASTFVAFGDGPDNSYVVGETTEVREPAAAALLGAGLAAAVVVARRPRRARILS